jgi:hypothetical protein
MNILPHYCIIPGQKNRSLLNLLLFSIIDSNQFEAFTPIKSFQRVHDADFLFPFHQKLEDL